MRRSFAPELDVNIPRSLRLKRCGTDAVATFIRCGVHTDARRNTPLMPVPILQPSLAERQPALPAGEDSPSTPCLSRTHRDAIASFTAHRIAMSLSTDPGVPDGIPLAEGSTT